MRSSYNPAKSCYGKAGYNSRSEAKKAKDRHSSKEGKLSQYYCDVCGKWHLGHNLKSLKGKRSKIIKHSAFTKRAFRSSGVHPEIKRIIEKENLSAHDSVEEKAYAIWSNYPCLLRHFDITFESLEKYIEACNK